MNLLHETTITSELPCSVWPKTMGLEEDVERKEAPFRGPNGVNRVEGFAPIREYAAIGDGRTVALVARDGAIDWLCLPNLDSPSVFAAILDTSEGGRFVLEPEIPYESTRRYVPGTNVLETTFATAVGTVRVTDALTLPLAGLAPHRELVRRMEGLSGRVPMRWSVEARFGYGMASAKVKRRGSVPVATFGRDAIGVVSWGAGEVMTGDRSVNSAFPLDAGAVAHLVLSVAHDEPLVFPSRDEVDQRLELTVRDWQRWSETRRYEGRWQDAVIRSALALKLLVYAPSGAIAAAPTVSLPETIGGERNWDYRFSWPRDAAFTLEALLGLGCAPEAHAFFSWLLHATQLTHPRIQALYRLDGSTRTAEKQLALTGYRGSRPVRIGNAAVTQTQLDVYGEVVSAAATLADYEGTLDRDHARRIAGLADFVCSCWTEPDAGIWETRSEPRHFTQSKMMCAIALQRARDLATRGLLPARHADRWRTEEERIRRFIEERCYSPEKHTYVRSVGEDYPDAALLLGILAGYEGPCTPRFMGTVDAIARELKQGVAVRRYVGDDGLSGEEGGFLPCSFWLVDAYARQGRLEEALTLMDELIRMANDVGLYSEEITPDGATFLGNFPQGLTHLALINAAMTIARSEEGE
jgi:GH15 family glucan-1,4-alpha-glucosidase